jgi:hypothetical protein
MISKGFGFVAFFPLEILSWVGCPQEYDLLNRKLGKTCSRAKRIEKRLVELAIIPNAQEFIQELDFKEFTNSSNA